MGKHTRESASLALSCLAVLTTATGYGISFPLISLMLERMGYSGEWIGINSAMPALGWIIGSLLFPAAQRRFGLRLLCLGLIGLSAMGLVGLAIADDAVSLMGLRFLFGGALGLFFRGIEYWVNANSANSVRGRNLAINAVSFLLGIAIGSAAQPTLGGQGLVPYAAILGLIVVGALPILALPDPTPQAERDALGFSWRAIRLAPIGFMAAFAYGLYEAVPSSLLSVYAVKNGLGEEIAAYTLTAAALGNLLLSVPLGSVSDHVDRRLVMICAAVLAATAFAVLPLLLTTPGLMLLSVLVFSGFAGSIYAIALAEIGDHAKEDELILANSAFGVVYAAGSVLGPLVNGISLDVHEQHGIIASVVGILLVFAILAMLSMRMRRDGP